METSTKKLGELLQNRQRWVVPVYQRHYEWSTEDDRQLDHLWTDLKGQIDILIKDSNSLIPHYFGAIITSPDYNVGKVPDNILVDGQQRITTFKLVLIALREVARKLGTERQISVIDNYLYNTEDGGMKEPEKEKYKLWPSFSNRKDFQEIVDNQHDDLKWSFDRCFYQNGKIIKGRSPKLLLAYNFLYNKMLQYVEEYAEQNPSEENAQENIIEKILHTFLNCFQIVLIQLGKDDDPQQIFASLNGLAEPLTPADLIRNDIFHRAIKEDKEGIKADDLYERKWCGEFESQDQFWAYPIKQGRFRKPRIDHLIGHLVVAETARSVNIKRISSEYKRYVNEKAYQSTEDEIDVLLEHAKTYKALTGDIDENNSLFRLKFVLDKWDTSTFYPLVMAIKKREFDFETEKKLFHLIESYIVRRTLCDLTAKNYNNVVLGLVRAIQDEKNPEKKFVERLFELKGDSARFPPLDEVVERCKTEDIYHYVPQPQIRYILSKFEEEKRSRFQEQTSIPEGLSIEHIMPRVWHEHWPLLNEEKAAHSGYYSSLEEDLSDAALDQFRKRINLIDTVGNLTLVTRELNASLGNGPWKEKREKMGQSILALNKELAELPKWDEDEIVKRSEDLAHLVKKIWPADVDFTNPPSP